MSVLNDREIGEYCRNCQLVEPYSTARIKSASYDLSVGEEYRFSSQEKARKLGMGAQIRIPPYTLCYVMTQESLNIPNGFCAFIFPRHRTVREGVLMYPQPSIDAGYKGRLYVLLHNLSNEERYLERGEHLASVVFLRLSGEADTPYGKGTDDKYMNTQTLEQVKLGTTTFNPYTSALKEVSDRVEEWREGLLSKWIPLLLVLMTIFLMLLTLIFGWRN
jgi:deoxycytidine triphosphate deaminase